MVSSQMIDLECLEAWHGVAEYWKPCPVGVFAALQGQEYCACLRCENGTVIWNAMAVTVICEHCYCRNPTGVFRTVREKGDVSWKPVSYCEVPVVVPEWWYVSLPRRGELEDDVVPLLLPRRDFGDVVLCHSVETPRPRTWGLTLRPRGHM